MKTKAMLIAAHPDDAEIAMGGTIASLLADGNEIIIVDLTNGEPTPYGSLEIRKKETEASNKILGITQRIMLDIPNREIYDSVENRKKLANVIREHKPDVLFAPYWEDAHPDHINAYALVNSARFYSKLAKGDLQFEPHYPRKMFHYFSTHLRVKIQPSFIYDISKYFKQKMASISAYESQFSHNPRNKNALKLIETESAYWGAQIGVEYGEPYVCKEYIKIADSSTLLSS